MKDVPSNRPSVELQPRDLELFRGLFESRVMTIHHIAVIHFDGHLEAAKKRVQRLKIAGYIRERTRSVGERAINGLTRKAFDELRHHGMLDDFPLHGWEALRKRFRVSDLTLKHELAVMDCKAAMYSAMHSNHTLSMIEFSTWPARFQFSAFHPVTGAKVLVKPDAFLRIGEVKSKGERTEYRFFLEVDRSTETIDTLVTKIQCYRDYCKRGGLAVKFGHDASQYCNFSFRVLLVCESDERRNILAKRLVSSNPPIRTFAALTTFEKFTLYSSDFSVTF